MLLTDVSRKEQHETTSPCCCRTVTSSSKFNVNGVKGLYMIRYLPVSRMGLFPPWCGMVCLGFFFTMLTIPRAEARSWKYLSELPEEERREIDARADTPRHPGAHICLLSLIRSRRRTRRKRWASARWNFLTWPAGTMCK